MVVDDMPVSRSLLKELLEREGHTVLTAEDASDALRQLQNTDADVVLTDIVMPGVDGFALCRAIKSDPNTRLTPVVLVTSLNSRDDRVKGIDAGADDFVSKPLHVEELRARVRSLIRLKRTTDDLDSADAVIMSLAMTVEARDPYTQGHCERLAMWAVRVGKRLGLGLSDLAALQRGGVIHDVGKIAIPDAVLLKTGQLTRAEFTLVKEHTIIGERLCSELRLLRPVKPIVRHHHERLDGSGYPDGLKGSEIPLLAQIVGMIDVYDALSTARPYKAALSPGAALEELYAEARIGLHDFELVAALAAELQGS
jgi:putative two-component system response regulator